ncbi:MAG TPA: adenylate/guanylate cyclase domain-containing protein [Candidatus Limnocylindrales bacterium]|nr:adenylate/guanylate cyclase domain-containing protein [Candidatus Limnocylindrales bacterium]
MAAPSFLTRVLAIADEPDDDDDVRLRKRIGIAAGIVTIFAPLTLPPDAGFRPFAWLIGVGLSAFSLANLVVLARTRAFERFVIALISAGIVFVPLATVVGGGVTGTGSGLVWGFLVPGYAILALGPSRATAWFVGWLAMVALILALDPLARAAFGSAPYESLLAGQVVSIVAPLAIVFLLLRYSDGRRRAAEARADALLTNAIPRAIARRLRHGENRIAETYEATTVLFADIVGFTPWAGATDPDRVVDVLDRLFSRFDELAVAARVEKIKTIGDAYMAAAGVPVPRPDHAVAALRLAREMLAAVADLREREGVPLEVRVGLASGPVVGGVIGRERILFDLWGDTVNTAARMESSGLPGRIQMTQRTRDLLASAASGHGAGDEAEHGRPDGERFESRTIDVKGLGQMTTYILGEATPLAPNP